MVHSVHRSVKQVVLFIVLIQGLLSGWLLVVLSMALMRCRLFFVISKFLSLISLDQIFMQNWYDRYQYIYNRVSLWYYAYHDLVCNIDQYFRFQNSNGQSEPFKIIFILICTCRPNLIFLRIFLLFFKIDKKSLFLDGPEFSEKVIFYLS